MEALAAGDPQVVGGFRSLARLGAGGMGRVYLATSPAGRMVVVKVVAPELAHDQQFIRRFHAEVNSARLVSGIYTAPVVGAGVDDMPPWLATAFVPGPPLDEVIAMSGPLPVAALWRLGAGLAEALRAIHDVGLVHRDLKPANVLLADDGPRVIDFGISRAVAEERLSATGPVDGSVGYMSPEQAQGHTAGPPSDVFSLGCVLAFAASGQTPFTVGAGAAPAAALFRLVSDEPDLRAVPAPIRPLIHACLAKDPARRPRPEQVAAQCADATAQLGLPTESFFWPGAVAGVIGAHQTALMAELQAIQASAAAPAAAAAAPPAAALAGGPGQPNRAPFGGGTTIPPAALPYSRDHTAPRPAPASIRPVTRRGLLFGGGAVVAASGAGAVAWALTRNSPSSPSPRPTPTDGATQRAPGTLAWAFTTSQAVDANLAVADGTVYFGSAGKSLYAVDAGTGREVWSLPLTAISAAPTVANGIVCVSAAQGTFYAVNAASGSLVWDLSGNQLDRFARNWAAAGSGVAVAIGDRTVRMYDAAGGGNQWIATTSDGSGFGQAVAAAGDSVYAVGLRGGLHALHADTGQEQYRVQVLPDGDAPATNLVVNGDTIYLGARSGPLHAVNPATGNVRWSAAPTGGFPASDPVVADGIVYFKDSTAVLRAVDAATGTLKWSYRVGGSATAGPAVSGGYVYVGGGTGLRQLDARTGEPGRTYGAPGGGAFAATPAAAGGLVFAGCDDHRLYAIQT